MKTTEKQSIKDRLKQFIMLKNISIREFERQIGVAYGFISNMSNSTSPSKLSRISHCFPDLNIEWLMTGEGEILKNNDSDNISQNGHHNTATMNGDITQNYAQSTDIIHLALGHSNGDVTAVYIEYDNEEIDEANRQVIDCVTK